MIPTVTKPFCGDCDRVRLTAEGDFRTCLFATTEVTLLDVLRSGGSDDDDRRADRGRRRHQVGGPPDQPGELRPPRQVDEPDRRLKRRPGTVPEADFSSTVTRASTPVGTGWPSAASPTMSTGPASRRQSHSSRSLARAPDRHVALGVLAGEARCRRRSSYETNHSPRRVGAVEVHRAPERRRPFIGGGSALALCRRSTSGTRRCRRRRRARSRSSGWPTAWAASQRCTAVSCAMRRRTHSTFWFCARPRPHLPLGASIDERRVDRRVGGGDPFEQRVASGRSGSGSARTPSASVMCSSTMRAQKSHTSPTCQARSLEVPARDRRRRACSGRGSRRCRGTRLRRCGSVAARRRRVASSGNVPARPVPLACDPHECGCHE